MYYFDHAYWASEYYISDGWVRALFKIYLLIVVLLIAIVGSWCVSLSVKRRLLKGNTVNLNETTGWIYGPSLAKSVFSFRALPGGWLGWLMLLVTVIDQVGEYGVAITVKSAQTVGYEIFPLGGFVTANTTTTHPSPFWEAYRWAADAQTNNYYNANATGLGIPHYGIYYMVTNSTNFMAQEVDEIGYWDCTQEPGPPLTYDQAWKEANHPNADEIYDYDIWYDLYQRGLVGYSFVFDNVSQLSTSGMAIGPSTHTVIISMSNATVGELYNLTAAVDVAELDDQGSKQMVVYQCILHATDEALTVESVARVIDIYGTMESWVSFMCGGFYPGLHSAVSQPVMEVKVLLQYYFNAMIMVSGVGEVVQTPNYYNYGLGIAWRATRIPVWILIVYVIATIFLCCLTALGVFLYVTTKAAGRIHDQRNQDGSRVASKEILQNTPFGLMDWMAHAAYTSRDADVLPEKKQLKDWAISTTWHSGKRLGIVKSHELGMVDNRIQSVPVGASVSTAMHAPPIFGTAQETTYHGPQQKGQYIALSEREVS